MNANQDVKIKIIVEGGCISDILIRGDKEPDIEVIDLDDDCDENLEERAYIESLYINPAFRSLS